MKKLPLLVLGVSLLLQPGFAQEQIPDGESLPFSGLTVREARRVNARLQNIYQKAVKEAQEITPGKMSDRLWSVDDPWVDRKGDSLVLVVAAIQTKDLPKWTGKAAKQAPASRDEAIWVSLSPELGMVMHNQPLLDSLSAAMRIKQILGLPPQADYGYIVQFWGAGLTIGAPDTGSRRAQPFLDGEISATGRSRTQAMDRAPAQYNLHFRPALSMDAIGLHLRLGQPLLFGRGQRIRHQTRCGDPHRTTRYHLALVHTASRLDGRGHTDKLSSIFTHNIPKIPGFVQGTCRFTTENS